MKYFAGFIYKIRIYIYCLTILITISESSVAQMYNRDWIETYGNDSAALNFNPVQISIDHSGFIYALSNKDSSSGLRDISLVKYNSTGNIVWNIVYASTNNMDAYATGISFDAENNIYLGGTEGHYMVIKYDSSGNFIWKSDFAAVGQYYDQPYAMSVSDSGTVYLTGSGSLSGDPNYNTDAWTCKINSSGNLIWNSYYNYPLFTQCYDVAQFIRMDKEENLIIAGTIHDLTNICKYDSSGNLLWTGNQVIPFNIRDIALDDSDNIYVTGGSSLMKFDSSGSMVYNKSITFPHGATINSIRINGEYIYATGTATVDTSLHGDVLTIKYDLNGDTLWTTLYNDTANLSEYGKKIFCDNAGHLFCTGSIQDNYGFADILVLEYDTSGNLIWTSRCGNALNNFRNYIIDAAWDSTSSVYITALIDHGNQSLGVIKIDSSDNVLWTDIRNNYQNLDDGAQEIIQDHHGNLIVGGYSTGMSFSKDIELIKYNSSGNQLWKKRIHYLPENQIWFSQMICDSMDNIYVCASMDSNRSSTIITDLIIVKFDSSGNSIRTNIEDGGSRSMVIGEQGSLYVLGFYSLAQYRSNVILHKYDVFGNHLWTKTIMDSAYFDITNLECLRYDRHLNFYATFIGANDQATEQNFVTMKLDTSGNIVWKKIFDGPGSGVDMSGGLLLDQDLNPIVIGYSDSLNYDMLIVKYDSSGQQLWNTRYAGTGNGWDIPHDAVCDSQNNIYVTGRSDDSTNVSDCFTLKLDSIGNILWTSRYISNYTGFPYSIGNSLTLDNFGHLIVAGEALDSNGKFNILVLVYDSIGNTLFTDVYHQPTGNINGAFAADVVADDHGSFYVTGHADSQSNSEDFVTMKYTDILLHVFNPDQQSGSLKAFPNPFNQICFVSYKTVQNEEVIVDVYNLFGKLISENKIHVVPGANTIPVISEQMVSGSYYIVLKKENGERISQKVISMN